MGSFATAQAFSHCRQKICIPGISVIIDIGGRSCIAKDARQLFSNSRTASFVESPRHESSVHETHKKINTSLAARRLLKCGPTICALSTRNTSFSKKNTLYGQYRKEFCSQSGSIQSSFIHSGRVELEDQPPSWLFVSPAVAGAYGAQVNVELDLNERLDQGALKTLRNNVESRGLSLDIDGLLQNFKALKQIQQQKAELVSQKEKVLQQIKWLKEQGSTKGIEEVTKCLREDLRAVKADIAALKSSWDLEEKVMLEALKLPNYLHPSTPVTESLIIREVESKAEPATSLNHVDIAKKFDLIKFSNVGPKAYYLKKDLVLAEMALTSSTCNFLQSKGYRHMSGPEFVKTPVVEGCGGDVRDGHEVLTMLDPHKTAIEPMNHLSGVSLNMFAAYVAKTCIGDSVLPLKMFGCGRRYQNSDLPGLFGAIQSTQAALFSCVREDGVEKQFQNSQELIWEFLQGFGFTLRLRQVCAKDLRREETRRVDFEIFSPGLQQLLPVASVSDVGDFLSRRLMVTHNQNHADIRSAKRLHMIHGSVLNITSFLALWMEHSRTDESKFTLCRLPHVQNSVFSPS